MDATTKHIDANMQFYYFIPSYSDAVAVHQQLGERFKDGSILLDDGDALRYFGIYVGSVIFFYLNACFWWRLFDYLKVKQFIGRTHQDKIFYTMNFSGCVHHIFVAIYSWYLLHNSCQNELGLPYPSENGGSFTSSGLNYGWLRNEVCMQEVNKGYVFNVLVSMAYMTVDYAILKLWFESTSVLQQQTIVHHIMAISGFGISLLGGFGMPGVSSASLLCEFSNVFLSLKEMFTKDTRNSFWGVIVQLLFFLSYTVFRFLMFPFLVYRTMAVTMLSWTFINWFRKICMLYCVVQASLVLLLNLYWYMLILKGLKRLLESIGVLKKPVGDTSYDDVEKYEASAQTVLMSDQKQEEEAQEEKKKC